MSSGKAVAQVIGLLALLSSATLGSGQQKSSPKTAAKSGSVSGRVFAVTKSGDLKPARMAKVYLLYMYRSVKAAEANPEEENSAGMAWMKNHNKAMEEYNDTYQREGANWSESLACKTYLSTYNKATLETLKWAEGQHKEWQILFADADEDGVFKISVPRPGRYTLLARGRAGFNDAFWSAEHVTVNLGMETTVKLSSPEEACLVTE